MPEPVIWFLIIVFAWIPLALLVIFFPIYLYNVAWLAFRERHPVLPLIGGRYAGVGNSSDGYYRLSGNAPKLYGVVCLLFGLATQVFVIDLAWQDGDAEGYATTSQKIELWIWLGCVGPLAAATRWVPEFSATAERVRDKERYRPFFWSGLLAAAKSAISGRSRKSSQ